MITRTKIPGQNEERNKESPKIDSIIYLSLDKDLRKGCILGSCSPVLFYWLGHTRCSLSALMNARIQFIFSKRKQRNQISFLFLLHLEKRSDKSGEKQRRQGGNMEERNLLAECFGRTSSTALTFRSASCRPLHHHHHLPADHKRLKIICRHCCPLAASLS